MGSVNSYYNITIQDGKYQIHKAETKPSGEHALDLLKKIQNILKNKMEFDGANSDPEFKPEETPELLGKIAKDVHQRYSDKLQKVNFFTRLFFGKEKILQRVHKDIDNYLHPSSVGLNPDMIMVLTQLLPENVISAFKRVNRESANSPKFDRTIIERAKSYGYEGESIQGAKEYITNLYKGLSDCAMCSSGLYNPGHFVCEINTTDYLATLANIKNLKDDKLIIFLQQIAYSFHRGRANHEVCVFFRNCIKPNQAKEVKNTRNRDNAMQMAIDANSKDIVKFLLETGYQPDSHWALDLAIRSCSWYKNTEIVKLLLDHGLKVINQHDGQRQAHLIAAIEIGANTEYGYALVKSILEHGGSVQALSVIGKTAWELANGDQKIIDLLNEYNKTA